MFYVKARLLKCEQLPAREGFADPLTLVSLSDDSGEHYQLTAKADVAQQLAGIPTFGAVTLEVAARSLNLRSLGGRGTAYRLRVVGVAGVPADA
jgi:hypothetical protein